MKLSSLVILLLALTVMRTEADLTPASPKQVPVVLPDPTPYAVTSRDANSRVWERTTYEQSPSGQIVPKQHSYTEVATGLHHLVNGQWVESKEEIDILPQGGAAATQGQHQAYFPGDIYEGQIELVTPDGEQLHSRPMGLSYFDGAKSVLIAELTNSVGVLVSSNQVIYPDAFNGLKADLRYTYTKAGFEQDIILKEQPFTPESFGLNPDTARLEVLTEFFDPPQPEVAATTVSTEAGDLEDDNLRFGSMQMMHGKAFLMGTNSPSTMVNKQWLNLDGRQFLVEEVPVNSIVNELLQLPEPQAISTKVNSPLHVVSARRLLPSQHLAKTVPNKPMRLAQAAPPSRGLVLDYVTMTSQTNFTFQGDTTYYISGTVNLWGTNTFEGGAVIKYAINAQVSINNSNLKWLATSYHPVIFTGQDDNTMGQAISGSTGTPTNYYANPALSLGASGLVLSNFRIAYAQQAVADSGGISGTLLNCQFVNCLNGLLPNSYTYYVRNALFANVWTNFNNLFHGGATVQNATFYKSACLGALNSGGGLTLNNCILASVTNLQFGGLSVGGDHNGFYNSPTFGTVQTTNNFYPFQTVGAGSYYLTNGCAFTNAGTTNIDSTLLASLKTKTTHSPIVFSNATISVATNFSLQAQRDTNNTPDLGYHYDPIDYFFGGVVAYSNVTFTAGTAVGWFELPGSGGPGFGLKPNNDVTVTFNGTVTSPCTFVRYSMVQEGANGYWTDLGWLGGIAGGTSYITNHPSRLTACFTRFALLALEDNNFRDGSSGEPLVVQATDCEILGGFGGYNPSGAYTNCLMDRVGFWQGTSGSYPYEVFRNCTFHGGYLDFVHWEGGAPYWYSSVRDCAFDGTSISIDDPFGTNSAYADYNYNAFLINSNQLVTEGTNNVVLTNGFNWQTSWFGNFYQPTNSLLVDEGDRTADQIGLYHFTTQTNQMKETNSIVDIGYHYVATDAYGNPIDSNGDGIPDYLEDANGNGLVDGGENSWAVPPSITSQPTNRAAFQGDNVTFSVTATGTAPLRYQWYFNGTNALAGATSASLTFSNVQVTNAGNYSVTVTNMAGSINSTQALLKVTVLFQFTNFCDTSLFQTNGNAAATSTSDGCVLELTPSAANQGGSAFLKIPVTLVSNASFSTFFSFRLSAGGGTADGDGDGIVGADGIVFVVKASTNTVNVFGGGEDYLGLTNSVGIEFDTWYNNGGGDADPQLPSGQTNPITGTTGDGNHVALDLNGDLSHTAYAHVADYMNNSNVWYAWIDYDGASNLQVRISETNSRPPNPVITNLVNLISYLHTSNSYVGFTAATGGSYNQQDILSWEFVSPYAPIGITNSPSVTIVSPTNEQFFIISPTNILLSATLTNFGGTLTNVSFYLGTNLLGNATGPDTNGFYDFVWQDAAAGTYSNITAHAADNLGASAISMAISIILNAAPIVRIITPTNLQSYLEVTNVTITAGVFDPDSGDSITNVVFNSNGTNLPFVVTQSGTNYSLIWSNLTAGAYPLTAVATDNHGASHPSSIRIFRVNPPSPPPLVAIIAPANYATFKPWPDVTITASAFSSAGITQVDFYNGTNYLGTDTTSDVTDNSTNFEITLHGLSPGTYSFTAKATDIASPNQTTISLPANITVQNSPKFPDPGFWDPVFGNFSVDPGRPDNPPALALQFDSQGNLFVGQEATTGESEGDGSFMIHADCSYWDSITSAGEGVFTSILLHGTNIYFGGESGFILWNGTTSIQIGDSLPGGDSSVCVEPISRTIKAIHAMNGDFYIGGNFTNSNIQFVAELVAGSTNWSAVATNRLNGSVWAIADFDNTLYIGGDFTAAGTNTSVQYLARLVNGDWQPVGSGVNARVCALTAHNGRLFVGGEFTVAGGLTNANLIACWDGTNWSSINNGLNNGVMPTSFSSEEVSTCFPTNRVSAIASRGDEIYVTGHFGTAWNGTNGITATNIARAFWDDTSQTWQWSALGNGLSYSDGTAAIGFAISIKDLSTSGSYEVIVGGAFGVAGETLSDTVARWIVGQPDCPTNGPSVFIDGSLDGSSPYVVPCGFPEDGIVQLNAQAFPTGAGMITNVNFYIDNNFVGSGYSYSEFFWQIEPTCTSLNLTPGIHIIQAVATDSAGLSAVSAPIQFNYTTCAGCFAGPTANPDNYYVISTNVTTSVTLSVLDNDTTNIYNTGTLQIVGLNTNQSSNPFESAPSAGGTFSIGLGGTNLIYNAGPYAFGVDVVTYAVADSTGTNSAVATVIVQPHSVIQIVQPTNGWTAYIPASFTVSGTTTNADTTINQVQFYVNNIAYGLPVIPDASGNFSLSWRSGRLGTNTFLAMATDHNNITSFSAPVTVYVTNNPSGSSGYNSPVAVIASPLPSRIGLAGAFVTNTLIVTDGFITNLAGSAFDTAGNTASWQILLLDANNPDASPINVTPGTLTGGFHVGGVTNASLGTVDLSTVENGAYILTLFVQSSAGVATASLNIALDSNLKLGQFSFSQQDLVIPVNGIPLTVTRTYDSQNQRSSDFGYGWTYSLNSMDVQLDEERQDWQVGSDALPIDLNDGDDGGGSGPIVSIRTGGSRDVTLTLPDGRRVTFQFYFTQAGYNFYAQWQAPPDVNYTLTAIGNPFFDGLIGYWNDIEGTSFDNYDFVSFVLQDKNSGTQYSITRGSGDDLYFDPAGDGNYIYTPVFGPPQLTQITQRNGATINISPSGIYYQDTNGVGRAVAFSRDSQNRIIEIYDPNAISNNGWPTLQYVYNHDSGNLVQVLKLVDGNAGTYVTNSFGYTNVTFPHFITSITNADGTQVAKNFYDDSGKLTAVQDANGNLTRFNYNTTNHIEQVVDRLGNTNTSVYDLSGNITVLTNGLGQITTMAYDTTNNKTNVVTYLNGQPYATNNYAYNPNNLLLSSTDPLGHTNGFVYDGNGDLLSSADAFGHVTVNTYDSSGNLTNTTDALQNSTVNFYDGNGLSRGSQDAVGTITTNYYDSSENLIATATVGTGGTILSSNTFAYDDNANRLTSTIWRKASGSWTAATTTYIYDAQNRVIQTIDPDGGTNTVVYDPTGRQNATIDKLGRATSYTYNALGQLIQTTYPDSTTETNGYDANGNRIASADRLNRVTTYVYDALNRLTQTIYADSTTNTSVYDDVGRVKFTIDARGITNAFGYDAAGRRLAVTNALGTTAQTISGYGYDANGNQLTFTDPNSHTTTNVFDALNRQVQVQYPDGTKTSTAYDADGRSVAQTNQDNLVTLFGYDGAGRLLSVTNALNQVTRYQYDEAGNQTAQIDALGRTNSFAYDGLGQRISHTMPMNSLVERFSYDLAGNMVLDTNFKSVIITNQYDAMNRLTNRASVGYNVSFAYSPTGQRTNMIDASGTNNYFYDNRDRLTNKAVAFANGPSVSLTYKYDANGNLTNLWSSTSGGVTNVYQYDALNRLTNVLGSGSTAANYNFDAVGNLQTIRYGNGVTNLYQYDSLNHLTNSTWKLTATTLASFYYQIGSTGNRTNLNEVVNGSNRGYSWKYDVLYRLTNETVSTTVPAGTLTYGYDAVGNRTNRSGSLGSLVSQTPTYNTNDWLNSDQYDANGNTTNSSGNFYQFDVMNHLTNVNSGSILMTYDGDGNRVSKKISGVTVYYLIDDKNPSGYIQVLEEYQGSTLSKVNNYGLSLISQRVPNTSTNYFIFDGHGSTRILTDIAGNFVNAFAYDAYGTLIASNGTPQTAYLYCCEPFDFDVGLYLNGARYLNPNTGRFWTMDSYEGDNEYPLSLHKYLYGADNPVNRIDPHGTSDMLIEFKGTNGAASKVDISWPHVADLTSQLNYAATNHLSITKLYFKGHGDDHDMYLEGGGVLTVSTWTGASEWIEVQNGRILAFQNGNTDITAQMRAVLGVGSVVILDGCHTGRGAGNICHDMSVVLPGVTVIGGRGYHLNVPFTHHTVGVINVYINGDLDGTFY